MGHKASPAAQRCAPKPRRPILTYNPPMPLSLKLTLLATLVATPILLYALLRLSIPLISRLTPRDPPAHSTSTSGLLAEFQSFIEPQIKRVEQHRHQSRADLHEDASSPNPPPMRT